MRLTSIKLSGFKSFVDPTTIVLPSNFTVVVGPNGCGKSNIIDAVRWVMGESAAARLRGDAMTDVIFSGSATRKPVAQASVELRFDNSDGVIAGEYAAYAEIAVRRTVSRDGASTYFLNGNKCRRRDITDLFLGTGLGPRSYAIIEQGMISQVIDAKPEELRAHLEEAAGITLYKERRRETLGRIAHTRENLERLQDLQGEIGRQLDHLREQAGEAARFRELEQQRATVHRQWLGLQWDQARQQCAALSAQLDAQQKTLQGIASEDEALEAAAGLARDGLEAAQRQVADTQAAVYATQAEQGRIEQSVAHARSLQVRQADERAQADTGLGVVQAQLDADQQALEAQRERQLAVQEAIDVAVAAKDQARSVLTAAEVARQAVQQSLDTAGSEAHQVATSLTREEARLEFVERQGAQLDQRIVALQARHQSLLDAQQADDRDVLSGEVEALAIALETAGLAADAAVEAQQQAEAEAQAVDAHLQALRARSQVAGGQLAALQTLQGGVMGADSAAMSAWLATEGLAHAPRLGAVLSVDPGWETAVETVLGSWLEAIVVPAARRAQLESSWQGEGRCWLVGDSLPEGEAPAGTLAAHVRGPSLVRWMLSVVHVGGQVGDAWWVDATGRIRSAYGSASGVDDGRAGLLERAQQLRDLEASLEDLSIALSAAETADRDARHAVARARSVVQEQARALDAARQRHMQSTAQLTLVEGQIEERQRQLSRSDEELVALRVQSTQLAEERTGLVAAVAQLRERHRDAGAQLATRQAERAAVEATVDQARRALAEARERQQVAIMERETGLARQAALEQALARGQQQAAVLRQRLDALGAGQVDEAGRLEALEREQARSLIDAEAAAAAHASAVGVLNTAQEALATLDAQLNARQAWHEERREALVQLRLSLQAAELARQHVEEQAAAAAIDLVAAADALPLASDVPALARQLRSLDADMARMGAVNLAAIEEYEKAGERHAWLSGQQADLADALATLEEAMGRIDRETRGRFKETFDRVNAGLQSLYPQLFGGGEAWLDLVGDDLLDAGVTLMARPPGKKVSALSLLSGGEKAMTAVALVFAIFQLNPAPFCLLDEVDAPLDEGNVGRLAALLRQMSGTVQFLAVSHNKATMEAADQLCGVTMRESGVSRMVSVDLAEAGRLAGAA